jgi:glycine oxidase
MKTIAVIGAGLMGRLIALSLFRQGYQVTLFDKDTKDGHQSAAYAAAGLLTPLGEAVHCEPNIVEMGFISLKLWPKLLASLDEYTFFQQQGAIMVSHEQDHGDYRRFARYLQNHYSQHQYQHLDRQQLIDLEPEIGRSFSQGLFLPEEGQIGNRKLLIALKYQLEQANIEWLSECLVESISPVNNASEVSFKSDNNKQHRMFDLTIDCRGIGARGGINVDKNSTLKDLRAVRGELFQLFAPDVQLSRPVRLMHPRYQLYIAPKTKGFYVVGATEIESDDNSPMTVRSAMELLSAAYSVHPGFAEANIRQHVSQCRPAFSDNQPKIIAEQHLIQVNGLYRHGFLIAPVVLEQVMQLINNIHLGTTNSGEYPYSHLLPISERNETIH